MDIYNSHKRKNWLYTGKSLKNNIENNNYVKKVREKLIKGKWKKENYQ